MPRSALAPFAVAALLSTIAASSVAVERCELNGESINPNNGNTTAGKTGLMRCRDGDGGRVLREQELQGGRFMGVVRYFNEAGGLEREYSVNEKGNRDGLSREYERAPGSAKPALVREQTYRNGSSVGIARTWYPSGALDRVTFYGDDSNEQAFAEFTKEGKLYELRCGPRAVLAPHADDARLCGHAGGASEVVLYNAKGEAKAKLVYERGERRKTEYMGSDGVVREQRETNAGGGVERAFYENGTKRRELQWVVLGGDRNRRVNTLEQEFHESGKLVHEKRWKPGDRGGELVSEAHWYLNGQPRDRTEYATADGKTLRTEIGFHDNGKKASEGTWRSASSGRGESQPAGTHKVWDSDGHLRGESVYDDRGRLTRERTIDASGTVVRDDEVFEDGSRKALSK